MSEKKDYLIQIIEKVKPAKIIDILYSQPEKIRKKKSLRKLGFILSSSSIFFLAYSIYYLVFNFYKKPNLIEMIALVLGGSVIGCLVFFSMLNIFIFIIKTYKYKGSLFSKMKKALYSMKYEWGIGHRDIENHNICHDLYKEISQHFKEDEMLKIVGMKLKNKDFGIDSIYQGKNEKQKTEQKKLNIENMEELLNNLNKEKILLEKRKEYNLKKREDQKILLSEFTKSLYK